MDSTLATLLPYVPPQLARRVLLNPALPDRPVIERFTAATLFADITGFTPLTEKLEQQGREGPEELTRLLNDYFAAMIAICEAEGGEVAKFAGDAMTVLFPAADEPLAHAVRRAHQAAERIQSHMAAHPTIATSAGAMPISVKIGVGAGEVINMQVGGGRDRWEDVLAGAPLQQMAAAEKKAGPGDIVLSPEAAALLLPATLPPRPRAPLPLPVEGDAAAAAALRYYIPGAVRAWLDGGLHSWLAVLRPMSVMFIQVSGLAPEAPDFVERLHQFVAGLQQHIYQYQATLDRLAIGDKGITILVLFGAPPFAHEDDPARAARCALGLSALARQSQTEMAVGITTGRVFAGPVGGPTRREYTVMADTVNLAARLMVGAGPGQIWCDAATHQAAVSQIVFSSLPPVSVKGKTHPVAVFQPKEVRPISQAIFDQTLVSRLSPIRQITAAIDKLSRRQRQVLIVEGEAGLGKSHLAAAVRSMAQERKITTLFSAGSSLERKTSYYVWRALMQQFFGLHSETNLSAQMAVVSQWINTFTPDQTDRLPLLGDLLGLPIAETLLSHGLDPSLRRQNLNILLDQLVTAHTRLAPLIIILDDAQWLDVLSWELVQQLARSSRLENRSLLLLLLTRPVSEAYQAYQPLHSLAAEAIQLQLQPMAPGEITRVAAGQLGVSAGGLPLPVAKLVHERAGGNPFFAEQMVQALRDQELIAVKMGEDGQRRVAITGDLQTAAATMPGNIHGLILSRIDRLPPEQQLTLKVAAVIGRTFAFTPLEYVLRQHVNLASAELPAHLDRLQELAFTQMEQADPEPVYSFKHIITREVAYQSLLYTQQRTLHATVLRWYEEYPGPEQDRQAPLLAYHSQGAEDRNRELHYTWLAGRQAVKQFANEDAITFFSRALDLTPAGESDSRVELLLAREEVFNLLGRRDEQAGDLAELARLLQESNNPRQQVRVLLRQGRYRRSISDFDGAETCLQAGLAQAQSEGILDLIAHAYYLWADALTGKGAHEAALELLPEAVRAARTANEPIVEGESWRQLSMINQAHGNYEEALRHNGMALAIFRSQGDKRREATALKDQAVQYAERGHHETAYQMLLEALAQNEAIGNRANEARLQNATGFVLAAMGALADALPYHQRSGAISHEIGDRIQESHAEHNLCTVYRKLGDLAAAEKHGQRALALAGLSPISDATIYAWLHLGYVLLSAGQAPAAIPYLRRAIAAAHDVGHDITRLETTACLAAAELAGGQPAAALARAEPVLTFLAENQPVGADEPLEMYHLCYQVLIANDDARAPALLAGAHAFLEQKAAKLNDPARRHQFLTNIPVHRQITALWASTTIP